MPFDPGGVQTFRFLVPRYEPERQTAVLRYQLDDGPELREEFSFPGAPTLPAGARRDALERSIRALHLVAGVSYYKAAAPPRIEVDGEPPDPATADFLDQLYLQGLGEFAYRNRLDLRGRIAFPRSGTPPGELPPVALERRSAIPVGGGKDSVVTLETLRRAGEPLVLLAVGSAPPILDVAARSGLPLIRITRHLAPELLELNRQGALNGHVPVTAILSFVFVVAAVLFDFDTIVMSNERSASVPTLRWQGRAVNHQYSKSLAFEAAAAAYIRSHVSAGLGYFSLLRPLSELEIGRRFAACRDYHHVFRSCNASFRIDPGARPASWCRSCPKCRFVFLILAPFVEHRHLVEVFGGDLLDDPEQERGYDELLGQTGERPFECVGETDEAVAAFVLLARSRDWGEARLVRRFAREVLPALRDPDRVVGRALAWSDDHRLPGVYREVLRAAG